MSNEKQTIETIHKMMLKTTFAQDKEGLKKLSRDLQALETSGCCEEGLRLNKTAAVYFNEAADDERRELVSLADAAKGHDKEARKLARAELKERFNIEHDLNIGVVAMSIRCLAYGQVPALLDSFEDFVRITRRKRNKPPTSQS